MPLDSAPVGVVYLARHGRTMLNAEGRLRGHLDPPLDDVGRQEILRLARALGGCGLTRVISSPLRRAMDTARAVADVAGLGVTAEGRLIDRDYGQWTGARPEDVRSQWGDLDSAPGVEAVSSVEHRVRSVLDEVGQDLSAGPVLLVAHDAVNRFLLASLDPASSDAESIPQRTACWNELVLLPAGWKVTRVDMKDEQPT